MNKSVVRRHRDRGCRLSTCAASVLLLVAVLLAPFAAGAGAAPTRVGRSAHPVSADDGPRPAPAASGALRGGLPDPAAFRGCLTSISRVAGCLGTAAYAGVRDLVQQIHGLHGQGLRCLHHDQEDPGLPRLERLPAGPADGARRVSVLSPRPAGSTIGDGGRGQRGLSARGVHGTLDVLPLPGDLCLGDPAAGGVRRQRGPDDRIRPAVPAPIGVASATGCSCRGSDFVQVGPPGSVPFC